MIGSIKRIARRPSLLLMNKSGHSTSSSGEPDSCEGSAFCLDDENTNDYEPTPQRRRRSRRSRRASTGGRFGSFSQTLTKGDQSKTFRRNSATTATTSNDRPTICDYERAYARRHSLSCVPNTSQQKVLYTILPENPGEVERSFKKPLKPCRRNSLSKTKTGGDPLGGLSMHSQRSLCSQRSVASTRSIDSVYSTTGWSVSSSVPESPPKRPRRRVGSVRLLPPDLEL